MFFDKADALFGRRSEVRKSHDGSANMEIAYLQRMDICAGLEMPASNFVESIDDAFFRARPRRGHDRTGGRRPDGPRRGSLELSRRRSQLRLHAWQQVGARYVSPGSPASKWRETSALDCS